MKILPMLAKEYNLKYIQGPIFLQPKLNGHRLIWDGKKLWTRQGKPVLSVPGLVQELETKFSGFPLDGELYCHGKSFKEITQIGRRTVNITDDESICMYVYDLPIPNKTFEERFNMLTTKLASVVCSRILLTKTVYLDTLPSSNPNIFGKEYEGTMVRNASGLYKFGKRSSDLLKVKQFHDMEAEIIGIEQYTTYKKIIVKEGTPGSRRKSNGTFSKNGEAKKHPMVGAFICKLPSGVVFNVGSGLYHPLRKKFWKNPPIGKQITFQYQEISADGVPIFPTYLRMKEDL